MQRLILLHKENIKPSHEEKRRKTTLENNPPRAVRPFLLVVGCLTMIFSSEYYEKSFACVK